MMEGYEQKKYPVATKRYVQWLELESDEEAIREHRRIAFRGCAMEGNSRWNPTGRHSGDGDLHLRQHTGDDS